MPAVKVLEQAACDLSIIIAGIPYFCRRTSIRLFFHPLEAEAFFAIRSRVDFECALDKPVGNSGFSGEEMTCLRLWIHRLFVGVRAVS